MSIFISKEKIIIKNHTTYIKSLFTGLIFISLGCISSISAQEVTYTKPNLYAVVIGVNKLKTQKLGLKFANSDTLMVGKTLEKNSKNLFSKVKIIYLNTEVNTTKDAILKELKNLKNISENDLFIFYATSFAKIINTNYYMTTSDTQSMSDNDVLKSAISKNELLEAIREIPAKNKLLLFDTCYAGISIELNEASSNRLNIAAIATSNVKETAYKINVNGHSIFAHSVTDAIAGKADVNNDGVVSSQEFTTYVFNTVSVESNKYHHLQTPAYYQSGKGFNISSSHKSEPLIITQKIEPKKIEPKKVEKKPLEKKVVQKVKIIDMKPQVIIQHRVKEPVDTKVEVRIEKFNFEFDKSSIYLDIKNNLKKKFSFVNSKGEHLLVLEFDTNRFVNHALKDIDSEIVSKVKIGYHGDSFRVVFTMKTKYIYDFISKKDGLYIGLQDKK